MYEFLPLAVLVAFTVTITALLISGVVRLAVAADRIEPSLRARRRPGRRA